MKPRPTACITYLLEEWIPRTQHGWGYSWIPSEKPWWGVSKVTGAVKPHCSQEKVLRTQCYWLRHKKSYFQVLHLFWKSQLFSFNTFENTTLRLKPLWNSISPQPDKKIIKKKKRQQRPVWGKREYSLLMVFQAAPATTESSVKYSGISFVS